MAEVAFPVVVGNPGNGRSRINRRSLLSIADAATARVPRPSVHSPFGQRYRANMGGADASGLFFQVNKLAVSDNSICS